MRFARVTHSNEVMSSPLLRQLKAQARFLARLNAALARQLPALAPQCRVAAYRDGVLTLQTDNTALTGQLRYLQTHYLQKLRQHPDFAELQRIHAMLAPPVQVNRVVQEPLPPLSSATRALLLDTAAAIDDSELSEALRRLARESSDKPTRE